MQLQLAKKKDDGATEAMKKLRPLAEEIYDEVLPVKYKRPTFSKYNGEHNPWDHLAIGLAHVGVRGPGD